jgi:hypothetical protein
LKLSSRACRRRAGGEARIVTSPYDLPVFTHFLKTCDESIDFTDLSFENGCPAGIFGHVFAKKENNSGSTSVQIISKGRGKYKVVKTIGSSDNEQEIQKLVLLAKQEIERI